MFYGKNKSVIYAYVVLESLLNNVEYAQNEAISLVCSGEDGKEIYDLVIDTFNSRGFFYYNSSTGGGWAEMFLFFIIK